MCSMTNLCFMCINDNKCNIVNNRIVTLVEYLMPEITIIKLGIPLHICPTCEKNLYSFNEFKQACVKNSQRLEARFKEAQGSKDGDLDAGNINAKINIVASKTNIHKFEEIFIKEEPPEVNSTNSEDHDELNGNISKEECVTDNDVREDSTKKDSIEGEESVNDKFNKDNPKIKSFPCPECNKNFTIESKLKTHIRLHNGDKDYHCATCNKMFARKNSLERHMKTHTGIKDHKCSICNKLFNGNELLQKHIKIHSGIKDFPCSLCHNSFTDSSSLTKHMKIHIGIKAFQCSICKKAFIRNSDLKYHMKIHSGIKEFKCTLCNKMFTHHNSLKIHMKVHAGIKEFQCPTCKKYFMLESNLKRHLRIHVA